MSFKAKFLLIDYPIKSSFNIKIDRALETPFHFHPEIELITASGAEVLTISGIV